MSEISWKPFIQLPNDIPRVSRSLGTGPPEFNDVMALRSGYRCRSKTPDPAGTSRRIYGGAPTDLKQQLDNTSMAIKAIGYLQEFVMIC